MKFRFILFLVCTSALMLTACGKSDGGDQAAKAAKPGSAPAGAAAKPGAAAASNLKSIDTLDQKRILEIGEKIFKTTGGNTCNDCHGMAGHSGRLKEAADLRKPSTWKAYKATGGDAKKMDERLIALILDGAGPWNTAHPKDLYDVQMLGVTQGATKTALKKIRKELKKKDKVDLPKDKMLRFGAEAAYAYVQTLKDESAPAAAAPAGDKPAAAVPAAAAPAGDKPAAAAPAGK
jgi:hypothetical protein